MLLIQEKVICVTYIKYGCMNKILCTGTFDILHPGHLDYFRQAKEFGDFLIVVIARDSSAVKEGKTLRFGEQERLANVATRPLVNKAILGNEGDKLKIVEQERPDIICLGYDQKVDEEKLKEMLAKRGLTPKIIRAQAYHPEKYKSSLLRTNSPA
jgi:FAD synthetase